MDERIKKYGPEIILMFALVILYYMKRSHQDFSDTNFMLYGGALCGAYFYHKNKTHTSFHLPSVMQPASDIGGSTIPQPVAPGLQPFR